VRHRSAPAQLAPLHSPVLALLLALLLVLLAGCSGGEAGDGSRDTAAKGRAERLKSLPYLSESTAPRDAPTGVVVFDEQRACPGYRLYTIAPLGRAELIDERGEVIRRWESEGDLWMRAELLQDGSLLVLGVEGLGERGREGKGGPIPDSDRYVMKLDSSGGLLWKRHMLCHHDIEQTPDGNLLVLTFERRKDTRIHESLDVRDERLTLLSGDGDPVTSVSILDAALRSPRAFPLKHVEPFDTAAGRWVDVFHANSIEWMRREGLFERGPIYGPDNVLMCFRNQDRIAVLNWPERKFVWSWGRGDISGPHDAQVLDNGDFLLFDNGLSSRRSRAVELDPVARKIVWTYEADPPESFFTVGRGSAQRLPNGNTLMAESDKGRAIEVTPDGTVVWDFRCPYTIDGRTGATIVRMVYYPRSFLPGAF
jgi:hypothetical protein